ncbi:MAG: DUF2889 domain-containing protein [Gammaproteobacteria bacterium]|nr:DUF2889 domain-containing protein [Gammaproteobacteria bacterium]
MNDKKPESPLNANYGNGVFRRKIQLKKISETVTTAVLEDFYHAFCLQLSHDKNQVISIEAHWYRRPFSACGGAAQAIEAVKGLSLSENLLDLPSHLDPRQQCTHIFDAANLAITHSCRDEQFRLYELEIPDMVEGQQNARLFQNGDCIINWNLEEGTIVAPEKFQGVSSRKGLTSWAARNLPPAQLEAVIVLQRGIFLSTGNAKDFTSLIGKAQSLSGPSNQVCYASQLKRIEQSVRLGAAKDYSNNAEAMLKFVDEDGLPVES